MILSDVRTELGQHRTAQLRGVLLCPCKGIVLFVGIYMMLDELHIEALTAGGSEQRHEDAGLFLKCCAYWLTSIAQEEPLSPSLISVLETCGLALLKYRKPCFHIRLGLTVLTDPGTLSEKQSRPVYFGHFPMSACCGSILRALSR